MVPLIGRLVQGVFLGALLTSAAHAAPASHAALARLLAEGDVAGALALAREGRGRRLSGADAAVAPGRGGSSGGFAWHDAFVGVRRARGRAHAPGGRGVGPALELVSIDLPDGRSLSAHVPSAADLPAASRGALPVSGLEFDGVFYADAPEGAADCEELDDHPAAHGSIAGDGGTAAVRCSIGGAAPARFASRAAAATEVRRLRAEAQSALRHELALDTDARGADVRGADARGLQLQPSAPSTAVFPSGQADGARNVLFIRIKWRGEADSAVSSPGVPSIMSDEAFVRSADANCAVLSARSFGRATFAVTKEMCIYESEYSRAEVGAFSFSEGTDKIWASVQKVAVAGTAACPNIYNISTFHHVVGVLQYTSPFPFGGVGSCPGKMTLALGQDASGLGGAGYGGGLHVFPHEIGHNLGAMHASTWAAGAPKRVEYGDPTDVMGGGGEGGSLGVDVSDFSAGNKILFGWVAPARILDVAAGAAASALIAASDRDNAVGDATAGGITADVRLAVRVPMPPRWYSPATAAPDSVPINLVVSYKGGFLHTNKDWGTDASGVYLNEVTYGPSAASGVSTIDFSYLHCYLDPTCFDPKPIRPFDAAIFDVNGSRTLVQVGGPSDQSLTPVSGKRANSAAVRVTVAALGANALPLAAAAALPATLASIPQPTVAFVSTSQSQPFALSAALPAAVFAVTSPVGASGATAVAVSTCTPGVTYPAVAGISAFFGAFPAAHVHYGGNVGLTGDVNAPGIDNLALSSAFSPTLCFDISFFVRPRTTVWVVVGSTGAQRGTAMRGNVTFTFGGDVTPTTWPDAYIPYLTSQGSLRVVGGNASHGFVYSTYKYLVGGSTSKTWTTATPGPDSTGRTPKGKWTVTQGNVPASTNPFWNVALIGVCPPGSYAAITDPEKHCDLATLTPYLNGCNYPYVFFNVAKCTPCPLGSSSGVVGATSPASCFCPAGWFAAPGATECSGPQIGGPAVTTALLLKGANASRITPAMTAGIAAAAAAKLNLPAGAVSAAGVATVWSDDPIAPGARRLQLRTALGARVVLAVPVNAASIAALGVSTAALAAVSGGASSAAAAAAVAAAVSTAVAAQAGTIITTFAASVPLAASVLGFSSAAALAAAASIDPTTATAPSGVGGLTADPLPLAPAQPAPAASAGLSSGAVGGIIAAAFVVAFTAVAATLLVRSSAAARARVASAAPHGDEVKVVDL